MWPNSFKPNQLLGENLRRFGYYPMVLTRNWDHPIHEQADLSKPTGIKNEIIKNENFEVHFLHLLEHLKTKFILNTKTQVYFNKKIIKLFRNYITELFSFSINRSFYKKASKIIERNEGIKKVLISASPFNLFFIGYKLKKIPSHKLVCRL